MIERIKDTILGLVVLAAIIGVAAFIVTHPAWILYALWGLIGFVFLEETGKSARQAWRNWRAR